MTPWFSLGSVRCHLRRDSNAVLNKALAVRIPVPRPLERIAVPIFSRLNCGRDNSALQKGDRVFFWKPWWYPCCWHADKAGPGAVKEQPPGLGGCNQARVSFRRTCGRVQSEMAFI